MKLTSKVNYQFGRDRQDGHYGDSKTIEVAEKGAKFTAFLRCGMYDHIAVYKDADKNIYVYSANSSLGYMGLEIFNCEGEPLDDIYLSDTDETYMEVEKLADINIVKTLANYFM